MTQIRIIESTGEVRDVLSRQFSAIATIFLFCLLLGAGCDRGQHPRELGKTAPAFTLHDGSQTVSLGQYRGKVVLVNFWASWCAPCVDELPSLLALHRRLPQLAILGVSIDSDPQAYRNFLTANGIDFPTIRDPSENTMHSYGTVQIPESYVIDRAGHIVRKYISAQDWTSPEIVSALSSILNAKN
jgi:cytochrome c biogenesis protein CcmG/thiol:disulfide interchange protein DsbE